MYKGININKIIMLFIFISIIGFFLPWFYFEKSVDYKTGIWWLKNPIVILGYFLYVSLIFLEKKRVALLIIIFIIIYLVYVFFTWHILTITGELNINTSISTIHYGFYVTLISLCITFILNLYSVLKKK